MYVDAVCLTQDPTIVEIGRPSAGGGAAFMITEHATIEQCGLTVYIAT
jgi:hypothetical protein